MGCMMSLHNKHQSTLHHTSYEEYQRLFKDFKNNYIEQEDKYYIHIYDVTTAFCFFLRDHVPNSVQKIDIPEVVSLVRKLLIDAYPEILIQSLEDTRTGVLCEYVVGVRLSRFPLQLNNHQF